MATSEIQLEINDGSGWCRAAVVELRGPEARGTDADTTLLYDFDYAERHLERKDFAALSCAFPVAFAPIDCQGWPPFLLDLFPQGAALRYVVEHHRIPDRPENYWRILQRARLNPPGNIRVANAELSALPKHPGFTRDEVIAKGPDFVQYMVDSGAPVAGTTGAGGASPKFLLREDHTGRFYADGVLADDATKVCWLVKFPRDRTLIDRRILQAEKGYHDVARALGLATYGALTWEKDCLFVPRFDRERRDGSLDYLGLESFYSLVGSHEFGSRHEHETYVEALVRFSDDPATDVIEYVKRDLANLMLGNTDNHGRNSSMLKRPGATRLSPLYDFAPMAFDPQGIPRNTHWGDAAGGGEIATVVSYVEKKLRVPRQRLLDELRDFHDRAENLTTLLRDAGVPEDFIERTANDRAHQTRNIAAFLRGA